MIKIAILGYGNLGRGVEAAIKQNDDLELTGVYTRRDPSGLKINTEGVAVRAASELENGRDDIDVLVICGGSATDLPEMTPYYARWYNVVDSFDTHANIPTHFANVDKAAKDGGKVGVISAGWDPGMFSVNRVYADAILPCGQAYTFWGKGVSQGHSDAVRRIDGVKDARQYTIPVDKALDAVRSGANPALTTREKHTREVFVVAEDGADQAAIENAIVTMPNYFSDYDTTVHFITEEEMERSAPRWLRHPQRHDRQGQQARHRIQLKARLQPRVHRLCPRRLRESGLPHEQRGHNRRENHPRHRSRVSFCQERRRAQSALPLIQNSPKHHEKMVTEPCDARHI